MVGQYVVLDLTDRTARISRLNRTPVINVDDVFLVLHHLQVMDTVAFLVLIAALHRESTSSFLKIPRLIRFSHVGAKPV
jgi:hypothetical protein